MSARSVLYSKVWNSIYAFLHTRTTQYLVESHQSPEHSACGLTINGHTLCIYCHGVSFIIAKRRVDAKHKLYATLTAVHDVANAIIEHLACLLHLVVQYRASTIIVRNNDIPCCLHIQRLSLLHIHLLRHRSYALHRVAHLFCIFRLCIETAPASSLHISFFATLWYYQMHATSCYAIKR